jgi:NTE family protein
MAYHFKNLVFEGGGVKGIAYVGAMEVLEQKTITKQISRVGGTSAGAINAVLFAAGYSNSETLKILKNLNFNNFLDDSWGLVRDTKRLVEDFGWYKGDFFHDWISKLVNQKLGSPNVTFRDLKEAKRPDLYVYGTNLSTRFGEVFSVEHTPSTRIADAVRISMSIPLFFAAFKNARKDVYVDGGVLNNYPVKLFDREIKNLWQGIQTPALILSTKRRSGLDSIPSGKSEYFVTALSPNTQGLMIFSNT